MKGKRQYGTQDLIDSLTAAALDRDIRECRAIVGAMAKGSAPAAELARQAKGCDRRIRSVEGLRIRLGLPPFNSSPRALAV